MKTLRFKNEFETADMVIKLQMSNVRFHVTGRTEIVVEDYTPSVLPTFFLRLLMTAFSARHFILK